MKKTITTEGATPAGRHFKLLATFEVNELTGEESALSRSLEWAATDTVGAIGIPLRSDCPYGQLYYELTRLSELTEPTRNACLLA